MAALEWWPHNSGGLEQRSERWMTALDTLFGGHSGYTALIESPHSYPSWRTAANSTTSDHLCLVLTLSVALLLNKSSKRSAAGQDEDDQQSQEQVSGGQQLSIDSHTLVTSIERLLMDDQHKQTNSSPVRSPTLCRSVLLHLCLVLLLVERLHSRSASTRAKSVLFSLLAASDVSAAHTMLSPPFQCCLSEASVNQWLWRQSTANQGAVLLHDQLLSSTLTPAAYSKAAATTHLPSVPSSRSRLQVERTHVRLSGAADSLASVEAAGPLQAVVRRWHSMVQRWRLQHTQSDHSDGSTEAPLSRSLEIEELLLCTSYLMDRCARKLATLDLLDPLTQLLASSYHRLLLPTPTGPGDERLFPAVEVASWLVQTLASQLSASALSEHVPLSQLELVFNAACHLLFVFTARDVEPSTAVDSVAVSQCCVQLMNAILARTAQTHLDTLHLLRLFTAHELSRSAMERLISMGFSPAPLNASTDTASSRALRLQLPRASSVGCEELVQLLRLQLQVECMLLCTALLLSSTEPVYALLDWQQCMSVLSHPCDEMKAAAFHYLAACFQCRVLRLEETDGHERKYEDDEDDKVWSPTEVDMDSGHTLLLAVQACLYPRQRLALSSAALDVLEAMLMSSTTSQRKQLLGQPWHTFVVHSSLLALAMRPSVHSSADESDQRVCQLHRYLHLLMGDDISSACECRQPQPQCVAERYLKDVDSRLLQPLLFCPAFDDQLASQPPAVVCRSSVYHYLTLLHRLHHSHLLPIRVTAQLPAHLRVIETVLQASCMAAVCPAAAVERVKEMDQPNERTAIECTGSSSGTSCHSQPLSQSQHHSVSQHDDHTQNPAFVPRAAIQDQHRAGVVMQCVCSGDKEGVESMVDRCIGVIGKLLKHLQL